MGAPEAARDNKADAGAADMAGGGAAEKGNPAAPQEGSVTPPEAGETNRAIIYNGTITVEVADVAGTANRAVGLVTGAQGFVGADKRSLYSPTDASAVLVLRVPSAAFSTTMDALGKLGKELDRSSQTTDVTEAVVDLDSRIRSQQASVDRTRALMAKANTIGEIVSVESELTKRESELASLQARKRDLANKVSYSTITLMLQTAKKVEPQPEPEKEVTGFLGGLKAGWQAFVVAVQVVLTIIGALLPFLVAVAIPVSLIIWLRRRGRRPAPVQAAPSAVRPAQPVEQGGDLGGEGR
ncbi:DUF4349 domain-containing protein [Luedemannella flava]